ncbi:MAG: hypothetical protein E7425_04760 [Ruminococcaceae bacterium]|nr:hypothetical protein [Oscillospiraceae bacterium]
MIQNTYTITQAADTVKLCRELAVRPEIQNAHTNLLYVFTSRFKSAEVEAMLAPLREMLPKLRIVGVSMWISDILNTEKFARLSMISMEESEADVLEFDFDNESPDDIVRKIREKLDSRRLRTFLPTPSSIRKRAASPSASAGIVSRRNRTP